MVRPCSASHKTQCKRSRARSVCNGSKRIQGGNKQPSGKEGPAPPNGYFCVLPASSHLRRGPPAYEFPRAAVTRRLELGGSKQPKCIPSQFQSQKSKSTMVAGPPALDTFRENPSLPLASPCDC